MNKQTQEALKMAIEALDTAEVQSEYDGLSDMIFKAINACKEALEQPAQEPVAWLKEYNEGGHGIYEVSYEGVYNAFPVYIHHTSQLMQKPYLWIEKDKGKNKNGDEFRITRIYHEYNENAIPLYTHPHQWQELTDDEITELHHNWITNSDTMYFARAIEQALRSKNAL